MADAVEQSLLLPKDMAELRSMRQHKIFLELKRDLAMVIFFFFKLHPHPFQAIQATFRAKEMVNYSHRKMKEEEGRRIVAVDTFHVAEKSNKELKTRLQEKEKDRKNATVALDTVERQVKSQRLLLHNSED